MLERLWRETVAGGAHELTLARLEALGGASHIVENHLLDALGRLTTQEQDVASDCFLFLVSSSGTKIARPAADLARWTKRPEPVVAPVLDKLCASEGGRILRAVAPAQEEGKTSFELFHDVLAEPILDWSRGHDAERSHRAARRRLVRVVSACLALVAVFAALGAWAVIERNGARQKTRYADSLVFSEKALDQAKEAGEDNGALALLLALRANETEGTAQARSAMTLALEKTPELKMLRLPDRGAAGSVALSPDWRILAAGEGNGTVQLWDVKSREPLGKVLGEKTGLPAKSIAFSPDGDTLATVGSGGSVQLWDVTDPAHPKTNASRNLPPAESVSFSPAGHVLAAGLGSGTVQLWDVDSHKPLGKAFGKKTGLPVTSVTISPDGSTLASVHTDTDIDGKPVQQLKLWNVDSHKGLAVFPPGPDGLFYSVAFSQDGHTLAGGYFGTVQLWDVDSREPLGDPFGKGNFSIKSVSFSPDGLVLATGDGRDVRWWKGILWSDSASLRSQVCRHPIVQGKSIAAIAEALAVNLPERLPNRDEVPCP